MSDLTPEERAERLHTKWIEWGGRYSDFIEVVSQFIRDVEGAEREACAALMDELEATYESIDGQERVGNMTGDVISIHAAGDAIRSRK
jgi:hypothetical protein